MTNLRAPLAFALLPLLMGAAANAQSLEQLVQQAAEAGPVLWYESSQAEQGAQIIDAFNKAYPDIDVEQVRVTGGNGMAATVIQEVQAGAETASLATAGFSRMNQLDERGLFMPVPDALGLDDDMISGDTLVNTAASVYVALWNTNAVADDAAPGSWEDFLDASWKGRLGTWSVAAGFSNLAEQMGEEETRRIVEGFAANEPMLFRSTYPLAQQVAAGEIDAAMGIYHTAQPPIQAGAPVAVGALDPTPVNTVWSGIVEAGSNTAGAAVLLHWLVSPEGARAYEDATNRGSAIVEGTETQKLLEGVTLAEWPASGVENYKRLMSDFNNTLAEGASSSQ